MTHNSRNTMATRLLAYTMEFRVNTRMISKRSHPLMPLFCSLAGSLPRPLSLKQRIRHSNPLYFLDCQHQLIPRVLRSFVRLVSRLFLIQMKHFLAALYMPCLLLSYRIMNLETISFSHPLYQRYFRA